MAMGLVVSGVAAFSLSGLMVNVVPMILVVLSGLLIVFLPGILSLLRGPILSLFRTGRPASWYVDLCDSVRSPDRKARLSLGLLVSILAWGCKLGMFTCLLVSLGVRDIPLWKIFFASAVTDLTMALPVHGLMSMGTVETGWVAGFAVVGISGMVEVGFAVHLLWLALAVVISCLCVPWLLVLRGSGTTGRERRLDG